MGKRSPGKTRLTAWIPNVLGQPIAAWLERNVGNNRTMFITEALTEYLAGEGIQVPGIGPNRAERDQRLLPRREASTAKSGPSRGQQRGGRVLFGAWLDRSLVDGLDILV